MLPRILIIDDLFGRNVLGGRNPDRENLCAHFLWQDITGDAAARASRQKVPQPSAHAVFYRGQTPSVSELGAFVENDLAGSLAEVRKGWGDALAKGAPPWAMVLLDLCFYTGRVTEKSTRQTSGMPEGRLGDDDPDSYFGLALLDAIHREFPELPIIILSSKPRDEVSREFSERGALGFIDRSDLRGPELLAEALGQHGLLPDSSGEIIGNSLSMLLALREARRAARHRQNLLLRGERGSGKEVLASYLHRASRLGRDGNEQPFVRVNSALFEPSLFSSELFGIEPRTATAVDGKIGIIEAANGGDLFLDEIADMPSEVQAAVLRVLQERQITRVGGRVPKKVDVRFLSATNADLEHTPRHFRVDLLDRLRQGGTIWLPPLRERQTDIPLLAEKLVRKAETQVQGARRRVIATEALELLATYNWPGNVRELESCLFDAVNRHPDVEHLVPGHLRITPAVQQRSIANPVSQPHDSAVPVLTDIDRDSSLKMFFEMTATIRFDPQEVAQWSGQLVEVQNAHSRLLARYLQAALDATKRRTHEHPEGIIQIHPAVKLITGDATLTASRAADIVKRLLGPLEEELTDNLREAYDTALRLRPKSSRNSS